MTESMRRFGVALFASCAVLVTSACSTVTNPATGSTEATFLSPEDEKRIGAEEHVKILKQYGGEYTGQPALNAYIQQIGEELVSESELPNLDFTFTLLDSDIVNAFALPGGYIYISRGLMALANNEAELAGVLAHEIGHVTARHSANRHTRGTLSQIGVIAATIGGAVLGGRAGAQIAQQAAGLGAAAYVQGYSRSQELEADRLGVRYIGRAGYDTEGMASFLETLGANDKLRAELTGRDAKSETPSWLLSHPRTAQRVKEAAAAAQFTAGQGDLRRDPYLAAINGLVYGDSPEQGFVRGNKFIHPGLGFTFTAPEDFSLQNSATAVLGRNKSGNAMRFDSGPASGVSDMGRYITETWQPKLQPGNVRYLTINGRPAASANATATSNGKPLPLRLYAIRFDNNLIYRFIFTGAPPSDVTLQRQFDRAAESLRGVTRNERQLKPRRIEIVRVQPGDSVQRLARRMSVEGDPERFFRVLNDLGPNDGLQAGSRVKIISDR